MEYETLIVDNEYEIMNHYPFTIRRVDNKFEPRVSINGDGYSRVKLNRKDYLKHRLIAEQFIPNDDPEHKTDVDHINGVRTDYHLDNLRWIPHKRNMQNLHSKNGIDYEFVDELEANSYEIEYASKWMFEKYYVSGDRILFFDGDRYRVLIKHPYGKQWRICMRDEDGVQRHITRKQLQTALYEQYDLMFFND